MKSETSSNPMQIVEKMQSILKKNKYHILVGEIGVGKTALVREMICFLNEEKTLCQSPSYGYYRVVAGKYNIIHVDMFRCDKNENAKEQILLYCEDFDYCFIEWGESCKKTLDNYVLWTIEHSENDTKRNYSADVIRL